MADWGGAVAVGAVALGGHILWDWLRPKKPSNGSGDKPPDFWRMEFRAAVREVNAERRDIMQAGIRAIEDKLDEILRKLENRRR